MSGGRELPAAELSGEQLSARSKTAERHVALLRGINVGGKNRLPMAELRALFEAAGAREVETLIQSGNVVFAAVDASDVVRAVERAIAARFGFEAPVVSRSATTLRALVAHVEGNAALAREREQLHVLFCREPPSEARIAAVDPGRSPPDRMVTGAPELLLVLPNGVGKSKLTSAYLDRTLGTVTTIRNWRTVTSLSDLALPAPRE